MRIEGVLWVGSDRDRRCRGGSARGCGRGARFWGGRVGFHIERISPRVVFAGEIRLGLVQLQDREQLRGTQQERAEDKCAEPHGHGILKMEFVCFVSEQIGQRYDRLTDDNPANEAENEYRKGELFEQRRDGVFRGAAAWNEFDRFLFNESFLLFLF